MQVINDACALGNNNTVDEAKRQPAADLGFRSPAVQPSLDSAAKAGPSKICEQCAKSFEPRSRSGGKPQRFCSSPCRAAYHASERQRGQRSPTLDAPSTFPAVKQPSLGPAPASDPHEFSWLDNDSIVLREQPETAIYWNPYGALVIRQCGYPDDDRCVFITSENIQAFIDRLTDIVGIPSVGR
jgi:hypothetical protein